MSKTSFEEIAIKSYWHDSHRVLFNKDCRSMSELSDESVQMCVTSPPYWGLRRYSGLPDLIWGGKEDCQHKWGKTTKTIKHHSGETNPGLEAHFEDAGANDDLGSSFCSLCGAWKGAYGLEPTPEMYVQHTIEILREIRRVLRKDGCVFLNLGDSYNGSGHKDVQINSPKQMTNRGATEQRGTKVDWLKPKDLCLIPFRVAIAAQEDGWWVRSVIIWNKPNPMPESVRDRPTESHEYILMLTKSAKYYWDQEAVREQSVDPESYTGRRPRNEGTMNSKDPDNYKFHGSVDGNGKLPFGQTYPGRNLRSVWTFPTQPYREAHFATYPEKLVEICVKAATPEVGCCGQCGKPWVRIVKKGLTAHDGTTESKSDPSNKLNGATGRLAQLRQAARERGSEYVNETKTLGWQPQCKCNADKVPSIVLDLFCGSGTSLKVAAELNRRAIGYELSEEYCKLTIERNKQSVMSNIL